MNAFIISRPITGEGAPRIVRDLVHSGTAVARDDDGQACTAAGAGACWIGDAAPASKSIPASTASCCG